jgi:hypothetical protein
LLGGVVTPGVAGRGVAAALAGLATDVAWGPELAQPATMLIATAAISAIAGIEPAEIVKRFMVTLERQHEACQWCGWGKLV